MFPPSQFCLYKPPLYDFSERGMDLNHTSSADGKASQRAVRSNPWLYLLVEMDPPEIDVTAFNIYSTFRFNLNFAFILKGSQTQVTVQTANMTGILFLLHSFWRSHICECEPGMLPRRGDSYQIWYCVSVSRAPALFFFPLPFLNKQTNKKKTAFEYWFWHVLSRRGKKLSNVKTFRSTQEKM